MQDAALNQLRSKVKTDGTIEPSALADWKRNYAGALKAIDEHTPGFSSRFDNAAEAADKLAEFGSARKAQEAEFQKSAAAKFIGLTDPREVENRVGQMLTTKQGGVTQLRQLVAQASRDPEALEGLRKAALDFVARRISHVAVAGPEAGERLSYAGLKRLVQEHEPNLSVLLRPEQVNFLRALARDMEMEDRSVQATRIKGSPGTAKDILPFLSKGAKEGAAHTGLLLGVLEALQVAHESGGLTGVATVGAPLAAGAAFKYWRGNAMAKVHNLVLEGLKDPEVARRLVARVPRDKLSAQATALSNFIRRGLLVSSQQNRQERATGGRINASELSRRVDSARQNLCEMTKPLMGLPDDHVAAALRLTKHG